MNELLRTILPLLAACASLAAGPALAGASGATTIGNVTLGVIDLTPQDGASAGYAIDSFESRLMVYTDTSNTGGGIHPTTVYPPPYAAGNAQMAYRSAAAGAGTTGAVGNVAAHASTGTALGLDNLVSADSQQWMWLTLAPHTLLTVSGNVFTDAARSLDAGEGYRVFSWASVDITDSEMHTGSSLSREGALIWGEQTSAAGNNEFFTLAFANPGAAAMAVSVNFLAYTEIAVTAAAVPEPASWGMTLAGLLLAGSAARRAPRRMAVPVRR
ncbi:PEP-CTERM protein-sorting domain-containing protein [Duganella sp. CF517]|uniref:PEP-CTERM sorting domain-containing protein n=1 Tax=Duganella sp. CF517 TaxID=1881038 RepID=UPI0008BC718D|nr:PEP-CTERM sorting domain-containing protein [Duganella sp. CF517]SEO47056.1 PEP-CTERM protein-sorting domain-containing protein [Duganella sp. CF517]